MYPEKETLTFGHMAALIVAFSVLSSVMMMIVVPFDNSYVTGPVIGLKFIVLMVWLWSAWRVKRRRDSAIDRKIKLGELWEGPYEKDGLGIPMKLLYVIRYRLENGEKVKRIFRRHSYAMQDAILNWIVAGLLVLGALLLLKIYPTISWHEDPQGSVAPTIERCRRQRWNRWVGYSHAEGAVR
jgi:hypothetical protein